MSNYCASCGATTGGGKFCPKCGAPQSVAGSAPTGPSLSQSAYAPQARRGSPVLKIVLVVVGLFLLATGFLLVKGYYFVKETVQEVKKLGPLEHAACAGNESRMRDLGQGRRFQDSGHAGGSHQG